jgi:hypothetical protein
MERPENRVKRVDGLKYSTIYRHGKMFMFLNAVYGPMKAHCKRGKAVGHQHYLKD